MKLAASLIVKNELGRYLQPCLDHLLEFCDEIRIVDDGSTDGTLGHVGSAWTRGRVFAAAGSSTFYEHEGRARQALLDYTLSGNPTHILAIDADEFVSEPIAIRSALNAAATAPERPVARHQRRRQRFTGSAWTLTMEEVWEADEQELRIRHDGGWKPHPVPILWKVPDGGVPQADRQWRIQDKALACGREPLAIRHVARFAKPAGSMILHFGWARQSEREARYERYVEHDGGNFHARRHLDSIMWTRERVVLRARSWPHALRPFKDEILERVNS